MNFEAVPCVLKNGEGTPMYGLLIRPLQNQQFLINVPSTTAAKQLPQTPAAQQLSVLDSSYQCSTNSSLCNRPTSSNVGGSSPASNGRSLPRRSYPTILPRDNNVNCNGISSANVNSCKNNSWNPVFIPATAVQNFQQSRCASTSIGTQQINNNSRSSSNHQSNSNLGVAGSHGPIATDHQTPIFTLDSQVIQSGPTGQTQQQQQSLYGNFNHSTPNRDINKQQNNNHLPNSTNSPSVTYSMHSNNFNNQQQQNNMGGQQSLSSSDLENIFKEFEPNEISNLLQVLSDESHDLVHIDSTLLTTSHLDMLEVSNDTVTSSTSNYVTLNGDCDPQTRQNQQQPPTRPPCRYQHFLMNGNNLRVNGNSSYGSSSNETNGEDYSMTNQSTFTRDNTDMQAFGNNYGRRDHAVQQQPFNAVDHHHESGTPDSGIQSIGESPQAAAQNSPMQHVTSSHSPLANQMSPRFFSSLSPYLGNHQNNFKSSSYQSTNHRRLSGDSQRMMEPLTVNTGCYEAVSDCESSPLAILATEEERMPGLLAPSTRKNKIDSLKSDDFTDMPILEPEGQMNLVSNRHDPQPNPAIRQLDHSSEKHKHGISNIEALSVDAQACTSDVRYPTKTISIPLNSVDPNSLVDKLLSSLAPDELTSFSQLFEAKLRAAGLNIETAQKLTTVQENDLDRTISSPTFQSKEQTLVQQQHKSPLSESLSVQVSSVCLPSKTVKEKSESSLKNINFRSEKRLLIANNDSIRVRTSSTSTMPDENTMKKLNDYRTKMKQKLINDTLIREINNLCEMMNSLLVPSTKMLTDNSFRTSAFDIDWIYLQEKYKKEHEERPKMETALAPRDKSPIDKITLRKLQIQNLETEASDSGSEDLDNDDHLAKVSLCNNDQQVFHQSDCQETWKTPKNVNNMVVIRSEKVKDPLKIKLRLLRNQTSASDLVNCDTTPLSVLSKETGEISSSSRPVLDEANESVIRVFKERHWDKGFSSAVQNSDVLNSSKILTTPDNLPLKKRFKHRNEKMSNEKMITYDSDSCPLSVMAGRKRRNKYALNEQKRKRNKVFKEPHFTPAQTSSSADDDLSFVNNRGKLTGACMDFPQLSVQLEPLLVHGGAIESRLPTLSPQVSPMPNVNISAEECAKKKRRLHPDLLRRCRLCWIWIKVPKDDSPSSSSTTTPLCNKCVRSPPKTASGQCPLGRKLKIRKHFSSKTSSSDVKCIEINEDQQMTKNSLADVVVPSSNTSKTVQQHLLLPKKKYVKSGLYCDKKSTDERANFTLSPYQCQLLGDDNLLSNDFCLPYDLWWEFIYQKDYVCVDPSVNYRKIRTNLYVDVKGNQAAHCQTCNCEVKNNRPGCGDECLNRMMFTECNLNTCQCGGKCSNQRFQKHQWAPGLERYDTGTEKGSGVKTTKSLKSGSFICEYLGEVVQAETFAERMRTWYKDCHHHYALNLDSGTVIDGYRCGSVARFINHSCEPNCEMQKWMVNGHYRMGIFALRDIEANEELSYNYNFHSFNKPQTCLCSSGKCTGAMGGSRVDKAHQARKNKPRHIVFRQNSSDPNSISSQFFKPLTPKERVLATKRRIFLLRNFDKLQKKLKLATNQQSVGGIDEEKKRADIILAQLTALKTKARSIRTRRLAESEENSNLQTVVSLAQVLQFILTSLTEAKDPHSEAYLCTPFLNLPSKKKWPEYFSLIDRTIDFNQIKRNVMSGHYETPNSFDADVKLLISNNKSTYSTTSVEWKSLKALEETYEKLKIDSIDQLRDVLGFDLNDEFVRSSITNDDVSRTNVIDIPLVGSYDPDDDAGVWYPIADQQQPDDDKVRCVCGIFEEDGTMIQCDKCLYWLHGDCVQVDGQSVDEYQCDYCLTGRLTARDVKLIPQPEIRLPQCVYYRSLSSGSLQIRLGECVYLKRNVDEKHKRLLLDFNRECVRATSKDAADQTGSDLDTSSSIGGHADNDSVDGPSNRQVFDRSDLRIMRVERLFVGPRGVRFIFGSYFAHPHETFCEPTRRFYKNEVFVTPLYDTWPIETVVGRCLIMDPQTYCKGRPRYPKYDDGDVYVCEYRVDKSQRLFDKSCVKNRYPTNVKPYIFKNFDEKMKIQRDFTPFSSCKSSSKSKKKPTRNIQSMKDKNGRKNETIAAESHSTLLYRKKQIRLSKVIEKVVGISIN